MGAAIVTIVLQGIIVALLLYFNRTFGAYTKALRKAQESNAVLYQQAVKILEHAETLMREDKVA